MRIILTAKTKSGQVIIATELSKQSLRKMRKKTSFYCPQCSRLVRLKVGEVVIPHFAHERDEACISLFSEGETKAHLLGKQQLYHFLEKESDSVVLEPYLQELAQRPDLLTEKDSEMIPIEFQCSRIPVHKKIERTNGYTKIGLQPIWILQTPEKHQTQSPCVNIFRFSRFEESFFTYTSPEGNVFLTYDPHFEKFHYFSSLLHVTGNQYIGLHRILSMENQKFPFARPKTPTAEDWIEFLQLYQKKRAQFLKSQIFINRKGINDPFLRACYELRIRPEILPAWIGLPVTLDRVFDEHACVWQLSLIRFMKLHNISFKQLTKAKISSFIYSMKFPSKEKVKSCLKYRDLFLNNGIDKPSRNFIFEKQALIEHLKGAIVAKG